MPADTLVYLETNDLAAALQPIVDSKPFSQVAKSKPDFSALKGVQLAVAVTGFETTEEKITDENSVGRVQPRFVAVADTHAWNYQAVKFAELKLGSFVEDIYDSEPTLEKSDKSGGKYFTWKAKDGRKAFALVIDSLIYFGNDESSIEKCLAVKRGEADSIAKTGKIQNASQGTLASGYVSTDGIAQIASIVGLKIASDLGEEGEVQSAIAGIVPQLIRNSITDISWIAARTEKGIEDKYEVTLSSAIAPVFGETITPLGLGPSVEIFAPKNAASVTRYDLKDARVAWRSVLFSAQKLSDPLAARMIGEVSNAFFEPYGIANPELFLQSTTSSKLITARLDDDGEKLVVIAGVGDYEGMKRSVSREIDFSRPPLKVRGEDMWQSKDGTLAFVRQMGFVIIGDPSSIQTCVDAGYGPLESHSKTFQDFSPKAAVITVARDSNSILPLIDILAGEGHGDVKVVSTYSTETRFSKTGMERRTVSDFGLIGSIIAQLAAEQ